MFPPPFPASRDDAAPRLVTHVRPLSKSTTKPRRPEVARPHTSSPRAGHGSMNTNLYGTAPMAQSDRFLPSMSHASATPDEFGQTSGTSALEPLPGSRRLQSPVRDLSTLFSVPPESPYLMASHMAVVQLKHRNRELETEIRKLHTRLKREKRSAKERDQRDEQRAVEEEDVRRTWQKKWELELQRVREDFERQLGNAEEVKRREVNGTLSKLDALQQEREAQEAAEKEARIELLRKQAARKLLYAGLGLGFNTWAEFWEEKTRRRRLIQQAVNRMSKPALSAAFRLWVELRAHALKQTQELTVQQQFQEYERKLAAAAEEQRLALERQRIELTGSTEELLALREEKEKEERVELLRRQMLRRMMNADLSGAWSAWYDFWSAKTYAMQRLREVGNKFRSPELLNAFTLWAELWEEAVQAKLLAEEQARASGAASERDGLRGQLERMSAEYEQKLQRYEQKLRAASEHLEQALERQRVELTGSAAEQAALREEKEKEERVELLRRQMLRRMMNADLSGAWSAWYDFWSAKTYSMQRLREVGNRLRSPELSVAFNIWSEQWFEAHKAKLEAQAARADESISSLRTRCEAMEAELLELRSVHETKVTSMTEERVQLMRKIASLDSGAAEAIRLREEQEAAEKEARIEEYKRKALRRMKNAGLSFCWSAWVERWEAKVYALGRLREVGNRLRKPELAFAYYTWRAQWEEMQAAAMLSVEEQREAEATAERERMRSEMEQLRADYELKLASAEQQQRQALERLRIELAGTEEEKAALEAGKAREERIELLRRQMVRKLKNLDISRGFGAWHEMWEAKTYALGVMRRAAGKVFWREQHLCFIKWVDQWREKTKLRAEKEKRREMGVLESQLSHAQFEVGQLKLIKVAHEDELVALREKLQSSISAMSEKEDAIAKLKPVTASQTDQIEELELALEAAQEVAAIAESEREKTREQAASQHQSNQELLERLLTDQRQAFEGEKGEIRAEWEASDAVHKQIRQQLEMQVEEQRDSHQTLVKEARREKTVLETSLREKQDEIDALNAEQSSLEGELERAKEATTAEHEAVQKAKQQTADAQKEYVEAQAEIKRLQTQVQELEAKVVELEAAMAKLQAEKEKPPVVKKPPPSSTLGNFKIDAESETPVPQQIAAALRSAATRVLDLMREWDSDGDGEVSRQEFHKAMTKLGLDAPKKDIDALFSDWDADGGGTLDFKELKKILQARPQGSAAGKATPAKKK
jgi:hypothetical protein